MRFIFVIITIIFFTNCSQDLPSGFKIKNNNGENRTQDFIFNELKGDNIGPIDKYGLIDDIHYMNNTLLMQDVKFDSIFIKYNINGKIRKSFISGEGPNEIVFPEFMKITSFSNFSTDIQVYEFNKGLYKINFNEQIKEPYYKIANHNHKSLVQSIVEIEDSVFAIANLNPKIKFIIYNDIEKTTKEIAYDNDIDIINNKSFTEASIPKDIGFNKKHEVIYTWNGILNSIDLHDKNGIFMKSYRFGSNKNVYNKKFERKYFYYYNLKSHDDYIYGLYAGFNTIDNFTESLIPNLKSELHVFNIKTDEIKRYKLDRLINSSTIDFNNNIVYCIEENSESQPLVKYEIPQKN